jgi:phosphocarrier protein
MSDEDAPQNHVAGPAVPADALSRELLITNKRGLHARASAKFVQMVEQFDAEVSVTRNGETVGGTSIMGLMMLAAGIGTSIMISAKGPQARQALDALADLVTRKFGEDE